MSTRPLFWITYAWDDDKGGDFSYLVQELRATGVEAIYDRVALIPGKLLWEQIGEKITKGSLDGWGYLVTPNSLFNRSCREELAYALNRALDAKGRDFPIIGLLKDVKFEELPSPLKVRLCVSLADPNWKEAVKAGLQNRPPQVSELPKSRFIWQSHRNYSGSPNLTAIEIRPRFEEVMYWRVVFPASASIIQWGHGPSNGGPIAGIKTHMLEGTTSLKGINAKFVGAGDRLSASISAYVVFGGTLPQFVGFGLASDAFGLPGILEIREL